MTPGAETPPTPSQWIVRAGIVTPESLIARSAYHYRVPGLFGFSVQHEPGRTIDELAQAGGFPNRQISVAMVDQLISGAVAVGYSVRVVRSPGRGYHHTVEVPDPFPIQLARALSRAFIQRSNPSPLVPSSRD
jgi:hypothetical protein